MLIFGWFVDVVVVLLGWGAGRGLVFRAVAYSDLRTVAASTNKVNTTRPTNTRSARSTAPNPHYIVILSGG
jgi:hypothetical protein